MQDAYFLGEFAVKAFTLFSSSSHRKLDAGDSVQLSRPSTSGKGKSPNHIIRFKNADNIDIGRIWDGPAKWMAVLMDLNLVHFSAMVMQIPQRFSSNDTVTLLLSCSVSHRAFLPDSAPASQIEDAQLEQKANAFNRLFKRIGLFPLNNRPANQAPSAWVTNPDGTPTANMETIMGLLGDSSTGQALPTAEPSSSFKLSLRPYQKQGLHWLLDREKDDHATSFMHPLWDQFAFPAPMPHQPDVFYFNTYTGELSLDMPSNEQSCLGGILADEMGLGKTVMLAALVQSAPPAPPESSQSTLVVAPMSLLSQWVSEFTRATNLTPYLYYGSERSTPLQDACANADIVITSYGVLSSEWSSSQSGTKAASLYAVQWNRVILDEAHLIRSKFTVAARAAYALRACRRWCITGTPVVNQLDDAASLLHFLRLSPWGDFRFFNTFITKPFLNKDPKAISVIRIVLGNILLRRLKSTRDVNGNPLLSLPPKHIHNIFLDLSPQERLIYKTLFDNAKNSFVEFANKNSVLKNVTAIFGLLTRLRQAVLHPLLILKPIRHEESAVEQFSDDFEASLENLVASYAGSKAQYSRTVLDKLQSSDPNAFQDECPICLDAVTDPVVTPCLHVICRSCLEDYYKSQVAPGGPPSAPCPVCSSGPYLKSEITSLKRSSTDVDSDMLIVDSAPKRSKSNANGQFSIDSFVKREQGQPPVIDLSLDDPNVTNGSAPRDPDNIKSEPDADPYDNGVFHSSANPVKVENLGFSHDTEEPTPPPLLDMGIPSSTKMSALIQDLVRIQENSPKFKAVVFSQFTSFLDLLQTALESKGFHYVRFDGTVSQQKRHSVVHEFNEYDGICIMLISLRAGGVGLNLTAANHVYLMDCWWNLATEDQAVDRVHRFGQTEPVHVTRFFIRDSVEANVLRIQERKRSMVEGALGDKTTIAEDFASMFN